MYPRADQERPEMNKQKTFHVMSSESQKWNISGFHSTSLVFSRSEHWQQNAGEDAESEECPWTNAGNAK